MKKVMVYDPSMMVSVWRWGMRLTSGIGPTGVLLGVFSVGVKKYGDSIHVST